MGSIIDILQYILPAGALASMVTWLIDRSVHNARSAKERHDLYRQMYEDAQETNLKLQQGVQKLQISFIGLERAVSKAMLCKYYGSHCPVRNELQSAKRNEKQPHGTKRQPGAEKGEKYLPRAHTTEHGEPDNDRRETG